MIRRMVASIVCLAFIVTGVVPAAMAQGLVLPPAGQMVALSPASAPCLLRGMRVDASDPLRMDFLFDEGRAALAQQEFNDVSMRLIKYFLVSLTIPNKDLWVNLSPYESQRIVQEDLGRTAMGRDLLAQDYILKQLTASLLHPDGETGKVFWKEVYRRAYEAYGTTDIRSIRSTRSGSCPAVRWSTRCWAPMASRYPRSWIRLSSRSCWNLTM